MPASNEGAGNGAGVRKSMNRVVAALLEIGSYLTGARDRADGVISRVFEDNFDGLVVIGEDGRIIASSKVAATMLLGPAGGVLVGREATEVLPPPMREAVQRAFVEGRRAVPTPLALANIGDPQDRGYIVQYVVTLSEFPANTAVPRRVVNLTFWDETERRRRDQELAYLGTHDPSTGAVVRREFVRQTNADLRRGGVGSAGLAVVQVGIASFDALERTLGVTGAGALLRQVYARLRAAGFETVARLDSPVFAVSRAGRFSEEKVERLCKDLIDRLTRPYPIDGQSVMVGVSLGVAQTEVSGLEAESLLSHSAIALSCAREQLPANAYVVFDKLMAHRLRQRRNLAPALGKARQCEEMTVVYQPQCHLETGALVGVEASIRWVHPDYGVIPPTSFLPLAEESGEIIELGRWALRTACREISALPFQTRLSINVSAAQFALSDIVGDVKAALDAAGMPPNQLEIEVAEAPFLAKSDQIAEKLRQLHAMGIGITVDEFGSGYSSLGHLARLSVDKIKVASGFVSRLPGDGEAGAVIRAVMTLAFSLEKSVLADGVETEDQAWMLRMMGCRVGQGPFYGRPRSASELVDWYRDRPPTQASAG